MYSQVYVSEWTIAPGSVVMIGRALPQGRCVTAKTNATLLQVACGERARRGESEVECCTPRRLFFGLYLDSLRTVLCYIYLTNIQPSTTHDLTTLIHTLLEQSTF